MLQPHFASLNLASLTELYRVLYSLLARSGLRISEALGLEIGRHFSADCSVVYVRQQRSKEAYFEVIPIVSSHFSTNWGQAVIGNLVRRRPKACPPCAYRCISAGTPAFFSAM